MFGKSIKLFTLFGFEVKIDLSWLLLALLVTWSLAVGLFPLMIEGLSTTAYWLMGVAGTLGLFFAIVFHEFSHSLVARKFDMPMKGITLFLFGGMAEMESEPTSARSEFWMAISGPISSLVLGFIFFGLFFLGRAVGLPGPVNVVLVYLAYLNIVLAIFNMIPAYPLDGGRVLRSALWAWKKDIRKATKIASQFGSGFGVLLIVFSVIFLLQGSFITAIWWFLIGLFVRNAAKASYDQLLIRLSLEGEPVQRFMNTDPVTVSPEETLEELVENYIYKYHFKMYPVVEGSQLVGCVSIDQVKGMARDEWPRRHVADVLQDCSSNNAIAPDQNAAAALSIMKKTGNSRLLVVDSSDRLVGIVSLKDLMKYLSVKMDIDQDTLSSIL